MANLLHGEPVAIGDRVFDVSATRGIGTVASITSVGIEVQFQTGPRVIYKSDGAQTGKVRPTLFWRDPILVTPRKNERGWHHQKMALDAIRKIVSGEP